ncbi:Retrotransposon protein [Nesidiocoris tenuis]|uniref:Retrotransposon protein n=1 Tax=Nesidiocoris tenuis TaxID=355587 RepID=A0ABN7BCU2_9HEMI|nr:Retrotransposon protein [Nesidiocoris tenuis]
MGRNAHGVVLNGGRGGGEINNPWGDFVVISAYLSPNEPHEGPLNLLDRALFSVRTNGAIVMGDFNAWATQWGSSRDTPRGQEVQLWAAGHSLIMLNRPELGPTFSNVRGSSNIDLTFVTQEFSALRWKWSVAFCTASDHALIEVSSELHQPGGTMVKAPIRYNTRRAPWRAFRAEVESRMIDYSLAEDGCALGGAEAVNDLQQVLLQAADLILDRRGTRGNRAPPWWNSDLDALRMQRNSSRRAWQRGADGRNSRALSSAWRSSSREFKRALRRAKGWFGLVRAG